MITGIPTSATTNSLILSGAFDKALITGVKAFIIATKAGATAEPIERPKANSSFLNS
ncbi:tail length tape-measure protein [Staphylococcus phage vB-SscS-F1]|nr:tail length tape-measure protein [Arcanobacterium phage vB-ApyS-JF1]